MSMRKTIRNAVGLLTVAALCGTVQTSFSGEPSRDAVDTDFSRYVELMGDLDARRSHYKEFKDLFIYFNYGDGSAYRASGREETAEALRRIRGSSAVRKTVIHPAGSADGEIYAVLNRKLALLGLPDLYRRYVSVERWQADLDDDPYTESVISVRLSLDVGTGRKTALGFVCPRKDMAHIIFVVDPEKSQQDFENVYTLSEQKHVTDSCDCVGCLAARLVDVVDFDEDGRSEIVTYETIYGMGHYKVYGRRADSGIIMLSYHPPWRLQS